MQLAGFEIRKLTLEDMDEAALVHRASFDERLPWLSGLHTPDEDSRYFRGHIYATCTVWGAFEGVGLVGFIAFRKGWIDQLYVLPGIQRRGVGSALLEFARSCEDDLSLWTFQRNTGARRFYERHDFAVIEETDGARNEEREPDVLYRWRRGKLT